MPAIGSQAVPVRKSSANFDRASCEFRNSSTASRARTATMIQAKVPLADRNNRSGRREAALPKRFVAGLVAAAGGALQAPDPRPGDRVLVELFERLLLDLGRQRRVADRLFFLLAVGEGPAQERDEGLALGGVRLVLVDEQVGVGGERVGVVAGAVDDRAGAEVVGEVRDRAFGRRGDAVR